ALRRAPAASRAVHHVRQRAADRAVPRRSVEGARGVRARLPPRRRTYRVSQVTWGDLEWSHATRRGARAEEPAAGGADHAIYVQPATTPAPAPSPPRSSRPSATGTRIAKFRPSSGAATRTSTAPPSPPPSPPTPTGSALIDGVPRCTRVNQGCSTTPQAVSR